MEKLLSVKDIMDRYRVGKATAIKRMKEIGYLDIQPMMVNEKAVEEWEAQKTVYPEQKTPRTRHSTKTEWKIPTWEEVHRIA